MDNSQKARRWLGWIIRLGIGLGICAWLFSTCDRAEFVKIWGTLRPAPLVLSMLVSVGGVAFSAIPWKMMLPPIKMELSYFHAVVLSLASFSINNLMPGGLGGGVLRAWAVGRPYKRYLEPLATVILDRWISLLCLMSVALVMAGSHWEELCQHGLRSVMLGMTAMFAILLVISLVLFAGELKLSRKILARFALGNSALELSRIMTAFLGWRRLMGQCYLLNLVTPLADAYIFYLISEALRLQQPFWVYLLMVPAVRCINHLPVSVNAVGTQDAACVFYLEALGVGRPQALTVSMAMHFVKLSVACVCGLLYLLFAERLGIDVRQVQSEMQRDMELSKN